MHEIFILFVSLLPLCAAQFQFQGNFASIFNTVLNRNESPNQLKDVINIKDMYDFIVIGAGTGGCVVTNRLTENSKWDVLLIEAGNDESYFTDIPLLQAALGVTQYNWGYKAQKQTKACLLLKNGVCNWPTGKAVGGTSVIYDLLYNRGNKYDYDEWEAAGNTNWGYDDVLPYFKKSERATGMKDIDVDFHGFNGIVNVEHTPYKSKLANAFINTAPEFNYSYVDINGKNPRGFAPVQAVMKNGRKLSSSRAFLKPIAKRSNMHLSKNSFVTKILINPKTKQAFGVEFRKNGKLYRVRAKKEVILSAGTTNSAKLLMLSGVGPKEHLQDLNITVIQDLPVGYNLQDHVSSPGLVFLVNESITLTGRKILSIPSVLDYTLNNKGPYTVPGGAEAYAFLNTKHNGIENKYFVDLELILAGAGLHSDKLGIVRNLLRISDHFYNTVYEGIQDKEGFAVVPILMKPFSRGRIMLKSNNPYHSPLIYPNFFDDKRDLDLIVKGIKIAVAVGESAAFSRYGSYLNPRPFPGCEHHQFRSDAYYRCCVQSYTSTIFHYAGTCKMGPVEDPSSVVDPQLKVKGIKNLRVIDASIMPTIVAGHTNGPVIMIGEKGSDLIKETWKDIE